VEQKILDKLGELGSKKADRRDFLKKAGKAAAAVPAVALLLSANATPAAASGRYGKGPKKGPKKPPKKFGLKSRGGDKKFGAKKVVFGFRRG
jgi:hypothetical protein